jgi:hypothetical protein
VPGRRAVVREPSNTDALIDAAVVPALEHSGVEVKRIRIVDHDVRPAQPRTRVAATSGPRSASGS